MNPLAIFGLGVPELLIILAVVLLLFGGTRLAGLGKSSGKAIREFKQETRSIREDQAKADPVTDAEGNDNSPYSVGVRDFEQPPTDRADSTVHDAEVIDPDDRG